MPRLFAILNRNLGKITITLESPSFPCILTNSPSSRNVIILTSCHSLLLDIVYSFTFPSFICFNPFKELIKCEIKRQILSLQIDKSNINNLPQVSIPSLPSKLVDSSFLNDWIFCHNDDELSITTSSTSSSTHCPSNFGTCVTPEKERVVTTVEEVISFLSSQSIGSLCLLESSKDKDLNLILRILNPCAISFMCDLPDESFDQTADEESKDVSLSPSTICLVHFKSLSGTCSNELSELKQYRSSFYVEWIKVEASTLTKVSNLLSNSIKATLASEEEEVEEEKEKEKEVNTKRKNHQKSGKGHGEEKSNSSTTDDPSDDTTHATPVSCIESTSLLASGTVNSILRPFSTGFLLLSSSPNSDS